MKIEIINTGNELLLGTTLNTHGAWMGLELLKMGLRVRRQVTIPDGDAISEELQRALTENDVVIITGGLGPTSDDVTREETAKALGLELIEDEFAVRKIEEFFQSRGKEMASCNKKQALSPCGADILPNERGTAPGVYVPPRLGSAPAALFLLPGPPFELQPMFHNEVVPRLEALRVNSVAASRMKILSFIGLGESDFHQAVDQPLSAIEGLEVGYCARPYDLDLRLIGTDTLIEQGVQIVLKQFERYCYSVDGISLPEAVVKIAQEKGIKIATAESCTGGAIASAITDISGSSTVFEYGYVTYGNQAKVALLGVKEETLSKHGAVSEQVALEMADGAIERSGADIAIAVTGIAGPTGGSEEKPVGTVWMAVAQKGKPTEAVLHCHPRGREMFKKVVTHLAFGKLRERILGD